MEKQWKKILTAWRRKYAPGKEKKVKWEDVGFGRLVLIFVAGILLLVLSLPSGWKPESATDKAAEKKTAGGVEEDGDSAAWSLMNEYAEGMERQVERILSRVEGVGEVDVMITVASSEEKETLQKEDLSEDKTEEEDSAGGSRKIDSSRQQREPVLVEEEDENGTPYVIRLQSPQIEGIVVVAKGAGNGSVNTEIIEAVSALFSVEAHKIKVMKMQ